MNTVKKPKQLRIIFILNALMMILPFVFFLVITKKELTIGNLNPSWMLYTGYAYILSFVLLVLSIFKRNLILFRAIFALNILIAIPSKAWIGIAVALISFGLSFHQKVKSFFQSTGKIGF